MADETKQGVEEGAKRGVKRPLEGAEESSPERKKSKVEKDKPAKKDEPMKVYILFKETNLDDYKHRGQDWQTTNIVGVYKRKDDAWAEYNRRILKHVLKVMLELYGERAPEDVEEKYRGDITYSIFKEHFMMALVKDEDGEEEEQLQLKPGSDVDAIFDKLTTGEFCEQTKSYYITAQEVN